MRTSYLALERTQEHQIQEEVERIQSQVQEGIESKDWVLLVLLQREVVVRKLGELGIRTDRRFGEDIGAEDGVGVGLGNLLVLEDMGTAVGLEVGVDVGKELGREEEILEEEESGKGLGRGIVAQGERKVGQLVLHCRTDQPKVVVRKSLIEKEEASGRKQELKWAWEEVEVWRQLALVWEGLVVWEEEQEIQVWEGLGVWQEGQGNRACWAWEEETGWVDPFWVGGESW